MGNCPLGVLFLVFQINAQGTQLRKAKGVPNKRKWWKKVFVSKISFEFCYYTSGFENLARLWKVRI